MELSVPSSASEAPVAAPPPYETVRDDPLPTPRGYPRRAAGKPKDVYVDANIKSIARVVKQDRKKDMLGELTDWHAAFSNDAAHASLYWPVLNERDSFETVQREHARIAAALGIPVDGDSSTEDSDDPDDKDYHDGVSDSEDEDEDGDSDEDEEEDDDDDEDGGACAWDCVVCGGQVQTLAPPSDPFGCPRHRHHFHRLADDDAEDEDDDGEEDEDEEADHDDGDGGDDDASAAHKRRKTSEDKDEA